VKKNYKHIAIAYFFVLLIQLPSLWQLEHLFANDHGIVYHQNTEQFQKVDNNCGSLHKQLHYIYWFDLPIFSINGHQIITILPDVLPQIVPQKSIKYFSLRAPPLS